MEVVLGLFALEGEVELFVEHGGGGVEAVLGKEFEDFGEEVGEGDSPISRERPLFAVEALGLFIALG